MSGGSRHCLAACVLCQIGKDFVATEERAKDDGVSVEPETCKTTLRHRRRRRNFTRPTFIGRRARKTRS